MPGSKGREGILSETSYRSKPRILADILSAIVGEGVARPTHIMYKANLSWSVMQEYITNLESFGILNSAVMDGKRVFHLTQKGFALLNKYLALREDLSFVDGNSQIMTVAQPFSY